MKTQRHSHTIKMKTWAVVTAFMLLAPAASFSQTSSWEPMNRGLMHVLVYTLEVDPVDSLVIYCGTDYGNIYKTTDGGFNWALRRNGIDAAYNSELVSALYLDKVNRRTLYAGFGGRQTKKNLFVSQDSAASWNSVTTPANWLTAGILNIFASKGAKTRLFCGLGWYNGIYYTDDFVNWKQVLTQYGIQVIAGSPARPDQMFAGTSGKVPLVKTDDFGTSWKVSADGMGTNNGTGVRAITVSTKDANVLWSGVTGAGYGLFKSTNAGTNWSRLKDIDQISEIAVHPKNEQLIYLSAIGTGVWRSTDGGVKWVNLKRGMPTNDVMRVRIAPGYPVRVFAVTLKHGIFRLVDEEITEEYFR